MPRLIDDIATNPKYPVFIPSKGRWESAYTPRLFDRIGIPYSLVVQPQERAAYEKVIHKSKILSLPEGLDGLVPARNWIWDYAESLGVERFWTFDDNITNLFRMNRNLSTPVGNGAILKAIESFTERFENVLISGCQYEMFAPNKAKLPPFVLNTRVYSNMLILTDARDPQGNPYRNVGVYNDDTDLCLRALKDGWCTVLFNAFLIKKLPTMVVKGGNTPIYEGDGRLKMAQELQRAHPDVVKIVQKWGRWQHQVDYRPFKKNRLIPKPGLLIPQGVDNLGMKLHQKDEEGNWKPKDLPSKGAKPPGEG